MASDPVPGEPRRAAARLAAAPRGRSSIPPQPDRRVRLLVSVRSAAEALAALEGGADVIDVKDPSRGPLGMANPRTVEQVIAVVGGRAPVSVALGELAEDPDVSGLPPGIAYAKAGLHGQRGSPWRKRLANLFAKLPNVRPVAVAYSDCEGGNDPHRSPDTSQVLRWAIEHRAAGVLIDTYKKNGLGLFGAAPDVPGRRQMRLRWQREYVAECVARARSARMMIALAGQLSGEAFERAVALGPDLVAVRGAACAGNDRNARIDPRRVAALRGIIEAHNARAGRSAD